MNAEMTSLLKLQNLTKYYGNFCAVKSLDIEVFRGEIVSFLGVNGAGKTTTLRMIAGVLRPSEGEIYIGEHNLYTDPDFAKRFCGYIPDRPFLYPKLTAREYLEFVAALYDLPETQAQAAIEEQLKRFALWDWQHELTESFSHGMKQRLATCAALIHNPKILVVDEPMVGLDPHGAKLIKDYFRQCAQKGLAVFLSTHSLNVAEEISDRVIIIHRGKMIAAGTVSEIKNLVSGAGKDLEQVFLELTVNE